MAPITIRYASLEDAGLIAGLSRQTFVETFGTQNTKENMELFMNGPFSLEKLKAETGAPGNIFLLAYSGTNPVGYVRMRETFPPAALGGSDTIEIARLYATAGAIGRGVGKALMGKCLDIAAGKKKEIVWLGVWEHNQRAILFYERWGFEKFGTQPFLLGEDLQTDWLMKKQL